MRQERTIQATIFEVFAQHEIGCELKAMSQWLDGQPGLTSVVAADLRRQGVHETGRRGLPAESVLRCALLKQQPAELRGTGLRSRGFGLVPRLCPPAIEVVAEEVGVIPDDRSDPPGELGSDQP